MRPTLQRNIGWSIAGNVSYAISQWAVMIAVARSAPVEAVGSLAYAAALVAPVTALASLQLRLVMVTAAGRRYSFREFIALRAILLAVAFAVLAAYAGLAGLDRSTALTVVGVSVWRGCDAVLDIYLGRWQAQEEMRKVSRALVANGVLSLAGVIVAVSISPTAVAGAFGSAAGSLASLLGVIAATRFARSGTRLPPPDPVRMPSVVTLALESLPLGVVSGLIALQGNIPRLVLESFVGTAALGAFAATLQLTMAGNNVVAAIAAASGPRLVRLHEEANGRAFLGLLARLAIAGLALGIAGAGLSWVAGQHILAAVYGPEYGAYRNVLIWLSLVAALGFAASMLGHGMTMAGEAKAQTPLFVGVVAATAVGCLVLIPGQGMRGAAAGMAIGLTVQIAGSLVILTRAARDQRGAPSGRMGDSGP